MEHFLARKRAFQIQMDAFTVLFIWDTGPNLIFFSIVKKDRLTLKRTFIPNVMYVTWSRLLEFVVFVLYQSLIPQVNYFMIDFQKSFIIAFFDFFYVAS